ncbi:uncharacterized protein [Anabrus simplex]|uniref:uncharacterized protein n=1 Tax=Anabrus simplex TaxID=316456 RepID=UPI0034DDB20C
MEVSPAIHQSMAAHTGGEMGSTDSSSTPSDIFRDSFPAGFSLIVDDVDGDQEPEPDIDFIREDASSRISHDTAREPSPDTKEQSDARIQQIKEDAESRKNEFARLLEEHAQVIQQLKKMEHEPGPGTTVAGPTEA